MKVFVVDIGVLLEEDDDDFEYYSLVYDQKYGYYDEGQYYVENYEKAINDVKEYVKTGVDGTYGIVLKTILDDEIDLEEVCVEDEEYILENVVFSIAKINGKIVENFLEKNK